MTDERLGLASFQGCTFVGASSAKEVARRLVARMLSVGHRRSVTDAFLKFIASLDLPSREFVPVLVTAPRYRPCLPHIGFL